MRSSLGFAIWVLTAPQEISEGFRETIQMSDEYSAAKWIMEIQTTSDREVIMREFERFYLAALESLRASWTGVESVARLLLKHEEIDAKHLSFGGFDIYSPIFAIQRRLFGCF